MDPLNSPQSDQSTPQPTNLPPIDSDSITQPSANLIIPHDTDNQLPPLSEPGATFQPQVIQATARPTIETKSNQPLLNIVNDVTPNPSATPNNNYGQLPPQQPPSNNFSPTQFAQPDNGFSQQPMNPQSSAYYNQPQMGTQPFAADVAPIYSASSAPQAKKFPTKILAIVAAVLILLGGGSSAAYFGLILPNNPEHLWGQALKNTGKGYDKLLDYVANAKSPKSSEIKGKFKFSGPFATDGTFDIKGDDKNATIKADIGLATTRANLDGVLIMNDASKTPDMYLKFSGIKGIAKEFGGSGPELDSLDNQWIVIDHTLVDNTTNAAGGGASTTKLAELNRQDYIDIGKATGKNLKQYIFTDNSDNAALKISKKVGEETQDGRKLYHYEAGVNKTHLKNFVESLKDELKNTKLGTVLGNDYDNTFNIDSTLKAIDGIKDSDTVDVWVDKGTKLVRKVKLTDSTSANTTVELALNYNGGDDYPFIITFKDKDGETSGSMSLGFSVNIKTNAMKITLKASSETSGKNDFAFDTSLDITQSNDSVSVQKPTNAKTLNEIMEGIIPTTVLGAHTNKPWPPVPSKFKLF